MLKRNNLNTVRLALAAVVLVFHVLLLPNIPMLTGAADHLPALLGVQGFFVVSGILVTMSYEATDSLWGYFRRRARRILPAYFCVVLTSAILLSALSTLSLADYFGSVAFWRYLAANLAFMNFAEPSLPGVFLGNYKSAVDGSLWTIKIEIAFYCMVPFIFWMMRRWGRWQVLGTLFLLSTAWRVGFEYLGQRIGVPFYEKLAIQAPGQLAFFIIGALIYYLIREGDSRPKLWMAVVGIASYVLAQGMLFLLIAPLAVGLFIYWAGFGVKGVPDLGVRGDFSYGLYLYHWPVIQVLIALGLFAFSPLLGIVVAVVLACIAALGSWFLVEKRFLHAPARPRPSPLRAGGSERVGS